VADSGDEGLDNRVMLKDRRATDVNAFNMRGNWRTPARHKQPPKFPRIKKLYIYLR